MRISDWSSDVCSSDLLNPDWTGRVVIAGGQQGPRRDKAFYKLVQMVFQDPYGSLHPRHTVDRILMEPLAIHRLDNPDRRIDQVLGEVGLGSAFRFRYPHQLRSEEHTSELQSLMRISYAVFCLKKTNTHHKKTASAFEFNKPIRPQTS